MELTLPSVLSITSSVRDDIWHTGKSPRAYEWWYFSAISDDGRDAIIVIFLDNFIFSPRHSDSAFSNGRKMVELRTFEPKERYPLVSFTFVRDRKVIYRAMNEFSHEDMESLPGESCCRFGESRFTFEKEQYGCGYLLSIVAALGDGRRLHAQLEWLSIETDFSPEVTGYKESGVGWNIVAPRSDVSGKMDVSEEGGKIIDSIQFRGTGMHDHVVDDHWLPQTETRFHRGSAHFADCTAIFGRYEEPGDQLAESQLVLIRDGSMTVLNAWGEEQETVPDRNGIKHPTNLVFTSTEGVRLAVRCSKILDSSFFYLRMWNDVTLTLEDGSSRSSEGLSELIAPQFHRHRWIDWLANLRKMSKDF